MALQYRAAEAAMLSADDSLGPKASGMFDFTLPFEATAFTIGPVAFLILFTPRFIRNIFKRSKYMQHGLLLVVKLVCAVALVGCEIANIVLWNVLPVFHSNYTTAASIMSVLGSLCILVITYAEHMHSYRPSTFLSVFLSVTLLFDIAKVRSYFLRDGMVLLAGLAVAILVMKLALVVLEEISKSHLVDKDSLPKPLSRESVSGFWNRSFFLWLNSTLLLGFRSILKLEDLPILGPEFNNEVLHNRFRSHWDKANKTSKSILSFVLLRALSWEFAFPVPPRLCFSAFTLAQPFLFHRIISGIENRDFSSAEMIGILAATALIYLGIGLSKGYYNHQCNRAATFARGILGATIYDKTLKLSLDQLQQFEAITLVTTDMETIQGAITIIHDIWACAIELGIATYILSTLIGPVSVAVLIVTLLSTWASAWTSKRLANARRKWNEKTAVRVAATSNILAQLKSVKETGLATLMTERLKALRDDEIKASLDERRMRVLNHIIDMAANGIAPVVAIAGALFWRRSEEPFSIATIFTVLALVAIVTAPLTKLLLFLPQFSTGNACITRIHTFLLLDEVTDVDHNSFETHDGSFEQPQKGPNEAVGISEKNSRSPTQFGVELVEATLTNHGKTSKILDDVNLKMLDDRVNMIIGPVGCGKSVFLKAIMGEVKLSVGFVTRQGKLAYCDQSPWLQNMSIRDNIVAQCEFNATWYKSVLHSCALDEDVLQLPEGENTMVGSGGCNLSGGQKQRVAMARAVYSHPSIVLVDDALSSADVTTSKKVMSRLFGQNGIVRKTGATVVMTTNKLEHLAFADAVYAFETGGKLRLTGNDFNAEVHDSSLLQWLQQHSVQESQEEKESDVPRAEVPSEDVTDQPEYQRQRGDFSLYAYYLKSAGWHLIITWLLTLCLAAVAERMPQIFVRIWMGKAPDSTSYFVGFVFLGLSSAILLGCSLVFYFLKIVPKSSINMHTNLLHSVMNATVGFISATDSGSLLNRFSQDISQVSQQLPIHFMEFSYLIMAVLIDLAIVSSGATYAVALIPLFALSLYAIQHYYLRSSRQVRHLDIESRSPLYTLFGDTARGIEHIRAFHWQDQFMQQNLGLLEHSQRPMYYMYCIQVWLGLVLDMCVLGIAIALVSFGLFFPGTTSATAIGLSLVNLVTFSEGSTLLVGSWVDLETSLGSVHRTKTFNETVRVEGPPSGQQGDSTPNDWPTYGRIDFVGATARYNEADNEAPSVLNDISLTVEAGKKIGIVGRTGSGKSSLVLAILNFLQHSGTITIDGRDVKTVSPVFLRSKITTISQDGVELDGSLRLNLDPFDNPNSTHRLSDETLIDVLNKVGLWNRLQASGNLDTEISKFKLSGGEKQLLGIARAMLHNDYAGSKIVLMDEATSKMDAETDRRIQAVMAEAFEHNTVITVAHRLHAVENSDSVFEMQSGRIIKSLDRSERRGRANGEQTREESGEQSGEQSPEQSPEQHSGLSVAVIVKEKSSCALKQFQVHSH